MYAHENQVFSVKMGKENVPKANQEIDYRVYALGEEVEWNTSPLSRSPLWKNRSSTVRNGNRSSTIVRRGEKGRG